MSGVFSSLLLGKNPRAQARGFSLFEIMIIIVLIGIIAVVAVPRFQLSTTGSYQANTNSLAEALSAAAAKNYSLSISGSPDAFTVANCTDVAQGLPAGTSMTGFSIGSVAVTTHQQVTCTVTHTESGASATFIAVGT
jgi:MSHA pilin protein MshA